MSLYLTYLLCTLDVDRLLAGELWRLLTGHLIFPSTSQALFAVILFYSYRHFERQMGSRKYAAFLVFSWIVSSLLILAVAATAQSIGISFVPASGPYFFVFAQLAFYYRKSNQIQ